MRYQEKTLGCRRRWRKKDKSGFRDEIFFFFYFVKRLKRKKKKKKKRNEGREDGKDKRTSLPSANKKIALAFGWSFNPHLANLFCGGTDPGNLEDCGEYYFFFFFLLSLFVLFSPVT